MTLCTALTSLIANSRYDDAHDDGSHLSPSDIHSYLGRIMYNKRNKFDPLWNELIVAGYKDGKGFLGFVDLIGTMYQDDVISTGFASYICTPLLRKAGTNLSEAEAKKLLEDCLRVLFYRNTKASTKIQIGIINEKGINISEPYHLSTYWGYKVSIPLPSAPPGIYDMRAMCLSKSLILKLTGALMCRLSSTPSTTDTSSRGSGLEATLLFIRAARGKM